ncbi:8-oxo-dGTP diphosphatase [Raineyella antarctica]|uniref:8-oxo-dGTP diphosphatase n=1 Tax=Raineyella antarctica TaxID=1577474 RepID=A0A1G6GE65_9ACTN|nr:NUDIX hydrolase [Raineyella antarctica]SDB80254.1 8-oxo-dGTP diphosphatase [Raineyella antarctica]
MPSPILAAGAVVLRPSATDADGTEVLVIHRAGYDDWTLPKGHKDPGEPLPLTAVREVTEETGVAIRLGARLETSHYPVNGRPKEVHWWVGIPTGAPATTPDEEADVVRWARVEEATRLLTFESDRHLVAHAVELAAVVPFLLVRHGKALARTKWKHADRRRPLTKRGRLQARSLVPLLSAFGIEEVASSDAVRCVDTLVPYATARGLEVHRYEQLTEDAAEENPQQAEDHTRELAGTAASGGTPTAICGHRPVIPMMLASVGLESVPMRTGDCVVAYLDTQGKAVCSEVVEAPLPED